MRKLLHCTAAAALFGCFTHPADTQTADVAAKIYRDASSSVFVISVRDASGEPVSLGTGFLIDKNRLATNLHVVEGGSVFLEQGTLRIPASVEKRDAINDLAILKVSVEISATPIALSKNHPVPGESVFTIGNPEGLEKSISTGVIAGIRHVDGRELIQITAPISHGSSGGPVLDSVGGVVGITVAMMKDGQNLNFAVPVEKLEQLLIGQEQGTADLDVVFARIHNLKAAEAQQTYSESADSEWQKTFSQIDALFKSALDQAAQDPNLLVKIAEEATDTDLEAKITAAQRATDIKSSMQSNLLLGEGLKIKSLLADQTEQDNLRQKAEKAFRTALQLSKKPSAELYYDLADVLEDRGRTAEAESNFHRALLLLELSKTTDTGDVGANSIRGLIRTTYVLKKDAESASWFATLLNTGKANAWDWQQDGERLNEEHEYDDAAVAYRKAATLGGEWKNWCRAAINFWDLKDDDALSSARECLTAGTGKPDSEKAIAIAHGVISETLNRRAVYGEALTHAREAADLDSSNAGYFQNEADALFGLRRFQEAINASNQAIRLSDGKYASMHFRLGTSYFALENWQFAEQSFEKAAELDPTDTAAPYNVALCMQNLGYRLDAAKWFRELLRRNPQYSERADVERRIAALTQ